MAGNLTPEQLSQFNSAIAKAKELTDRQAEIIDKLIEGETKLAQARVANLNAYFGAYYSKLDEVSHKCDDMPEIFQLLANSTKNNNGRPLTIEFKHTTGGGSSGGQNNQNSKGSKRDPLADRNLSGETIELGNSEDEEKALKEKREKLNGFIIGLAQSASVQVKKMDEQSKKYEKAHFENLLKENTGYTDRISALKKEQHAKDLRAEQDLLDTLAKLEIAKAGSTQDHINSLRVKGAQKAFDLELGNQNLINKLNDDVTFTSTGEAAALEAKLDLEKDNQKALQALEQERIDYIAKEELKSKMKNNGILKEAEVKRIYEAANKQFKASDENIKKLREENFKALKEEQQKLAQEEYNKNFNILYGDSSLADKKEALKKLTSDEDGSFDKHNAAGVLLSVVGKLGDLAKQLDDTIDQIAGQKSAIDTRLQGSSNEKFAGSYWGALSRDMMSVGAFTPYFRQQDFANNIKSLVERGIAFDLKQRAFLTTIQGKIADTFDASNGTLLRLIRLQQEDSTAGRLGMESALNTFLNSMYENTEYLNDAAASVKSSLEEMQSFMTGALSTEVEYQVQKWMGSLYSVGMSQEAVNSIANAFGQITAGQIEGLTGGGTGNLIIMAANDAGISIAEMLTNGIDPTNTNRLLEATVNYLAEIAASSADNRVVQQQLASVFGVRASDLRAATNLASKGSISAIAGQSMSYDSMVNQLLMMAGTMHQRTSLGEMMTNIWENGKYSIANSMSNNPVSYLIYKLASVLDATTGGIALPFVNAMGFGVDLNTTVADLMRVAAVGTGLLTNIAPMISGLGSSFSGRAMLSQMGIESGGGLAVTPRGGVSILSTASMDTMSAGVSESGYIGNASSSDIKNATLQEASDTKKSLMVEAQEEQGSTPVDEINMTVLKIYELLSDVVTGASTLRVRVDSYGLVNGGNHGGFSSSGYLAGPAGLANQSASLAANSGYIGNSPATQTNYAQFFSGALDFGSWAIG